MSGLLERTGDPNTGKIMPAISRTAPIGRTIAVGLRFGPVSEVELGVDLTTAHAELLPALKKRGPAATARIALWGAGRRRRWALESAKSIPRVSASVGGQVGDKENAS